MNMKNILLLSIVLVAIVGSVAAVSASFYHSEINLSDNNLTIDGVQFTVPNGFSEDDSLRQTGEDIGNNMMRSTCVLVNGNDNVTISVTSPTSDNEISVTPDEDGIVNRTIANHNGFFVKRSNSVAFSYFDGGKFIGVTAPNEQILNQVLS